jgi:tetratricopeptide (TPR) repeat protein
MSAAFCHAFAAMSHIAVRRFEPAEQHATTAKAIADEYDLRAIGGMSLMFLSRVRLARGAAHDAADEIERILARRRHSDRPALFLPMHLSFLAEAYLQLGRYDDGLAAVADARRFAKMQDELAWWPEVLRLEALLRLASGRKVEDRVEALLREAMEFAGARSVRTQELRCANELAQLLGERGDRTEARTLLSAVYDRFSEGFDTLDLMEAQVLLDRLA